MIANTYPAGLLVFEGVDGAGKTTLISKTEAFLNSAGLTFTTVKMPSNRIRALTEFRDFHDSHDARRRSRVSPFSLTVLVSGDRLVTLETEVIPRLTAGEWVICDRYMFTGLTICPDPLIRSLTERFVAPSRTFLARVPLEVAKARVLARQHENMHYYDAELVAQQIRRYDALAEEYNFTVVDTSQDVSSAWKTVEKCLREDLMRLCPSTASV